jgi:ribosome biogenesis GTPase
VVDTPGFSSFDSVELNLELKNSLPATFREFRPFLEECRFVGCSHTKEKGCAVLRAVKDGSIHKVRHQSYLRLHQELKDLREWNAPHK